MNHPSSSPWLKRELGVFGAVMMGSTFGSSAIFKQFCCRKIALVP